MKKKLINFTCVYLCLSNLINAQTPFSKVYYDLNFGVTGNAVAKTYDNGFMIAGQYNSNAFVYKMDANGNYLWGKKLATSSSFNHIIECKDSSYFMVGEENANILCLRMDKNGTIIWSKMIAENGMSYGLHAQQTFDNGFALTGIDEYNSAPYTNIIAAKLDANGNLLWNKILTHGTVYNNGYSIKESADSNLVIIASYCSNSSSFVRSPVILKLSTNTGTVWWAKEYNTSSSTPGFANDIAVTNNGLVAYLNFQNNLKILKTDFSGTITWVKDYPGIYLAAPSGAALIPTKLYKCYDKGFVLVDGDKSNGNAFVKIDSSGNYQWSKYFFLAPIDIVQTNDTGFFVLGNGPLFGVKGTYNDQIGVVKTNNLGLATFCVSPDNGASVASSLIANSITFTSTNGGAATNLTSVFSSNTLAIDPGCVSYLGSVNELGNRIRISVFPNPFSTQTKIELEREVKNANLKIIDVLGKEVRAINFTGKQINIERGELKSGIYFLQLFSDKEIMGYQKIIIE